MLQLCICTSALVSRSCVEPGEPADTVSHPLVLRTSMGYEPATLHQFRISLGDFGAPTLKPVWLYASEDLTEPLTAPQRFSQQRHPDHASEVTVTYLGCSCCYIQGLLQCVSLCICIYIYMPPCCDRYVDAEGQLRCCGGPDLKATQE